MVFISAPTNIITPTSPPIPSISRTPVALNLTAPLLPEEEAEPEAEDWPVGDGADPVRVVVPLISTQGKVQVHRPIAPIDNTHIVRNQG